jgi:16S rRNA (cytosine1402-N4)-methyltransferase
MKRHKPVLVEEVLQGLNLDSGDNTIDCTLGDGGHSEQILEKTAPNGKLLGMDADPESLLRAKKYLHNYKDRITFVRSNFKHIKEVVEQEEFEDIRGILMDLGWSSTQFREEKRGFSFKRDEPLDMRYHPEGKTAADLVNRLPEKKLAFLLRKYGEEDFNDKIAKKIVEKRKDKKIETTDQLTEIVLQVYREVLNTDKEVPYTGKTHPATQVYQALRIAVNEELKTLKEALPQAIDVLEVGGRIAVISFHSLEDRIVKHFFKGKQGKKIKIINKKPITASEEELQENQKARSAKLRIAEKI